MEFTFEHNTLPGSLELAYMGDVLYELYVRSILLQKGGRVKKLHAQAVSYVCAHAQSEALGRIEERLTEDETDIVRRARNADQSPPRNANRGEYHRATALEALVGYLYITNRRERMEELLLAALPDELTEGIHEK